MGKTTRVVVCGMKSVGKTALLEQLVYGNVTPKTVSKVMLSKAVFTTKVLIIINCHTKSIICRKYTLPLKTFM